MKEKSILMPHCCQKTGWCLLLLVVLSIVVKALFIHSIIAAWYMAKAGHLLTILALFFICLSKEKEEDEMISGLRLKAIGITGYVFFVVFLLLSLVLELQLYHHIPRLADGNVELYLCELFLIVLPVVLFGLYYLLFKGMLMRSRKEQAS